MGMRVCALLMPRNIDAAALMRMVADLRAQAQVIRPDWHSLSDIELIEQVLDAVRNTPITATINNQYTTTKVGSLSEET